MHALRSFQRVWSATWNRENLPVSWGYINIVGDGKDFDSAFAIKEGSYEVEIDYFSFTVTESKNYVIQSSNNSGDTYGLLYDSSRSQIDYDDSAGNDNNFRIDYYLVAGETYYIGVRMYSGTGSFTVTIS